MAIIYTYPLKSTPALEDLILISDMSSKKLTKSATITSLKDTIDVVDTLNSLKGDINITGGTNITVTPSGQNIEISTSASNVDGSGTAYKIPMWSDSNTLTNSPFETSSFGTGVLDIPNYIRHIGDTGCFFGFNSAANNEFLVYTEGSGSPIDQESLRITPTGTAIKTNATNRFTTTAAGATELYYAGFKKFETTNTGSTLAGTVLANSLNLKGSIGVAPTYGAPLNISSSGGVGSGNQTAIYIDQAATANPSGSQGVKMNFKVASIGILVTNADSLFAKVADFRNTSNQIVGTITCTSIATNYGSASDYRIKENVVDMTGAVERVKQLKPSRFNFTADPSKTVDGFLAHEAQEVVPESVTGVKDALYPDGDPLLQGIDQSKIVPLLTGAIKELIARIEVLEAK